MQLFFIKIKKKLFITKKNKKTVGYHCFRDNDKLYRIWEYNKNQIVSLKFQKNAFNQKKYKLIYQTNIVITREIR